MLVEGLIDNFFLMVSMFSGSLQCHVEHCQRQMMQDNMNPWVDPHGPSPGSAFAKNVGGLTYWERRLMCITISTFAPLCKQLCALHQAGQ